MQDNWILQAQDTNLPDCIPWELAIIFL